MKKTMLNKNKNDHPQSWQLILAVLALFLTGGYTAQAQYRESLRTGNSSDRVLSGDELRKTNPINLWEAIRQLEPAFSVSDENSYGSDPNHIPGGARLKGSTSWPSQTSQPVFLLDNAVVDIRRICDLNINEVAEVIIRKDAATLSTYGLRGGNGVIEVQTVRPESGSIRLSYSFDGSLQRADLTSWHLLNAGEKLAVEKKAGLYFSEDPAEQQELDRLLTAREAAVAQGINTNWLKEPLRTAFSHRHKIDVFGGDEFVRYKFTLRAAPGTEGVMKQSKRDIYGADAWLEYRYRSLTLSNRISVDKIYAKASPYGSFNYYGTINPYYSGRDEKGLLYTALGENSFNAQANPLYETSLSSFSKQESMHLYDHFSASYSFLKQFRLTGSFTFVRDRVQNDFYLSPDSWLFSDRSSDAGKNNGMYEITHNNRLTYEGQLNLSYENSCKRSVFGAYIGLNVFQGKFDYDAYAGTGIPIDRMGFISFATAYAPFLKPDAREEYDRMLSGVLTARYSFDNRYEAQFHVRTDKSSRLAPDKRNAVFYGGAVQWNLHQEKFLKNNACFDRLTLQAAIGSSGHANFGEEAFTLTYHYNIGNEYIYNYYLIGAQINALTNPALKWSSTQNKNISLQAQSHGVSFGFTYYNNTTRNLPVIVPAALATGFENMPGNGGRIRNSGIEYTLSVDILKQADGLRLNVFTNGIHNKNRVTSVPEYFRNLYNKAVSGLAAGNGDGYMPKELTDMGKTDPKLKGTFGFRFSWKQWHLNTHFYFSTGGEIYNSTLAGCISGNPAYNMDRRVLHIPATAGQDGFVEKQHEIGLGTIRAGYEFTPETAAKLCMQRLGIFLTGNQLFHHSSADYQRGTCYPFARTVTVSLRATF